ncbi:MAG TPA: hypothetical protein VNL15_08155, partial [Dehalococcoidia bacterium]|nr:hypothetical protein [Dehalococcoidia bacterium]
TQAIYYFARKGKQPWQSSSTTAPTGIEFMPADAYAFSGSKTLLACEWLTGAMWLLQLSEDGGSVLKRRLLQRDCQLDLTRGPDGLIYYSNAGEIRRLQPVN